MCKNANKECVGRIVGFSILFIIIAVFIQINIGKSFVAANSQLSNYVNGIDSNNDLVSDDPNEDWDILSLNRVGLELNIGESFSLIVKKLPLYKVTDDVTWKSYDESIATVSDSGVVTAIKSGRVVIEVTSKEKPTISASCLVNVNKSGENTKLREAPSSNQVSRTTDKSAERDSVLAPKKPTLKKVSSTKKGIITATWKRDSKATGYQLTIAQNKKFTKGKKSVTISKNKTTKKTIKKLKSKKVYYAKVRAYKKSGNKKVYGDYSKVKKVKVK